MESKGRGGAVWLYIRGGHRLSVMVRLRGFQHAAGLVWETGDDAFFIFSLKGCWFCVQEGPVDWTEGFTKNGGTAR